LSKPVTQLQRGPAGEAASRIFSCLGDLLASYGRRAPNRNAILSPGRPPVTYGTLCICASRVARILRSLGVDRSDRVAVVLPDGPDTAVSIVAVASTAVCVPLNPSFTADEWRRYFGDLRITALLTRADLDTASRGAAQALGIPVIDLSFRPGAGPDAFGLVGPPTGRIVTDDLPPSGGDDAFILLTSGTSSRPKMVPLTHSAVCLSAYNVGATLQLGPGDRLLNVLPLFHGHGLISGVVAALAAGSSVVCPPGFDAAAFFGWLTEFRATWYTAVPAIHRAVLSAAARHKRSAQRSSLRLIRSASSTLPPDLLGSLEALFGVPVIDTYGMTEATTQIAANPVERRKPGSVGKAAGPEIAILDGKGRRLPPGKRGEIALRGSTIARGYDNDATATAAAFRDGWFRTGDLGYLDEDGYLFIVGRIKDVIDRGGQKVAPAEVEQALLSHPDVVEAAVFSVPHKRLGADVAAAIVLRRDAEVSEGGLRDFVRERLASFKVPGPIFIVPEIPKGPAGKIKRDELLAALSITLPTERVERGANLAAPRSEMERKLAETWMELLEVDQIGVDENVFVLGADSITVMQMLLRLRERFGVGFSFKDIFDAPTVAALAARIEQKKSAAAPPSLHHSSMEITRVEDDGPPQLSILQEHALRIERELPGLPQFNVAFAYRLRGPLNVGALARGLSEVVRRHDSLRTGFSWLDGVPVALTTSSRDINPLLVVEDVAAWAAPGENKIRALLLKKAELQAEQEALTPFDTSRPPLLRARLLGLGPDDHVLLLILHDIIADRWSTGILIEEISEFYAAFIARRPPRLPEPMLQFSDFARWQGRWCTSDAAARQLAFWKERLRGASPLFAPKRNSGDALLAANIVQEPFHLSTDLVARLTALSHSQGATLFMTLLTGFKTLLLARSGRNDICVATAVANRSHPRTERIIGPVGNASLVRTHVDADVSFQEALRRVRGTLLEAYARQELPFDVIAGQLKKEDDLDPASLMQVFFVLHSAFRRPLKVPNVAVSTFGCREGQQIMRIDRTWLRMTLKEIPAGITGACSYKEELFESEALRDLTTHYTTILTRAAAHPETSLGTLADRPAMSAARVPSGALPGAQPGKLQLRANRPRFK
jgi:acyl-CoA synthetase (AMP-forming)/AMP-acid ligase II/acyl carrier protein